MLKYAMAGHTAGNGAHQETFLHPGEKA